MSSLSAEAPTDSSIPRRWRMLESIERRVLGVLIEKAKTTPENYPLSLNALRNGCNQKSNRAPVMALDEDQIEEALDALRGYGAIAVVQGDGRVDKYRHLAYEWLGVEKVEMAVMAELLLRGAQTVGELRGRAARMEPIKDLSDLQPVLDALRDKGLIQYLTPPGRGAVVTHTLYHERELEKLRREHDAGPAPATPSEPTAGRPRAPADELNAEVAGLREEMTQVKLQFQAELGKLESSVRQLQDELKDLNRQLGN